MGYSDHSFIPRRAVLLGLLGMAGFSVAVRKPIEEEQTSAWESYPQYGQYKMRDLSVQGNTSLGVRAAQRGLIYGAAMRQLVMAAEPDLADLAAQECNLVVPEWELKWNYLRPSLDSFDFGPADEIARFAQVHGLLLRGHTLVWHEALPQWFSSQVSRQNARRLFLDHIQTVVRHYTGKMHSWDVVNEAIDISAGHPDGLRSTPWLKLLGADYIELAFRTAAQADPQALLFYNDYDLEYDTPEADRKRDAVLKLLRRLKSQNVPIHGLGIQSHLIATETRFNARRFQDFLAAVARLDLKILITELDMIDQGLPKEPDIRDRIVAGIYEDYLTAALGQGAVLGVINWGLSDRHTWIADHFPRSDGDPVRCLPYDRQNRRKLVWQGIARAFDARSSPRRSF
jgi:endo-1,4-beta-xylanase